MCGPEVWQQVALLSSTSGVKPRANPLLKLYSASSSSMGKPWTVHGAGAENAAAGQEVAERRGDRWEEEVQSVSVQQHCATSALLGSQLDVSSLLFHLFLQAPQYM